MFKKYWLIVLIMVLASFLRFIRLDSYPALNADEAAIGYNTYSLIQTGHDEHGHSWPIHFQSFNDYKPGLYFYIVLPFVKLLGLNEWSVRIPNAALGVISVYLLYLLVLELFKDRKFALISALFLAISPWHLQFSRGGWEVNTATLFILAGLLFFFKGTNSSAKKEKVKIFNLILSSVFLVASFYTYHAARVVVPLLGISILCIYRKEIFKNFKPYSVFIFTAVILLIPLILDMASPGALSRAAGVGLFADKGPINRINEQRGEHNIGPSIIGKILHNKAVNYSLAFAANWTAHFNGEFLFMSGDSIERNKVPETGEMYLMDILFLLAGIIAIARSDNKNWKFVISWLLIAPVASALTFQSPNALRSQNMVIPLVVISAYGLLYIFKSLKSYKKALQLLGSGLIVIFMVWNFARYEQMYWSYMSKIFPYSSQYGLKELVNYVSGIQSKYKDVFVTDRFDQPYILFLFYEKYPPSLFQGHHTLTSRDEFGFSTVADFDKYHFGPVDFESLKNTYRNSLIIGTPGEIPAAANIIERIYGTNGFEYFDIVSN